MKIEISYKNSLIGSLSAGESLALHLNGSKLTEDLIVRAVGEAVEIPSLSAPTIEIADSILSISDEEGLATSYDILVDGEVKATVEKVNTVSIQLVGGSLGMYGSGSTIYAKFGSAPTSNDDYDYYNYQGYGYVIDKDDNSLFDPLITVSPTVYIWTAYYKGSYEFTTSSSLTNPTSIQTTYDNPVVVDLSQAKGTEGTWILHLRSWATD